MKDSDTENNSPLSSALNPGTSSTTTTTAVTEVFTCIAYCPDNQTLCAGTNQGNLYTWKRINYSDDINENSWQLNNVSTVRGVIKQCTWGICETTKQCVLVNCIANVFILKVLDFFYKSFLWVDR